MEHTVYRCLDGFVDDGGAERNMVNAKSHLCETVVHLRVLHELEEVNVIDRQTDRQFPSAHNSFMMLYSHMCHNLTEALVLQFYGFDDKWPT